MSAEVVTRAPQMWELGGVGVLLVEAAGLFVLCLEVVFSVYLAGPLRICPGLLEQGIGASQNCSGRRDTQVGGLDLPGLGRLSPGFCSPSHKDPVCGICSLPSCLCLCIKELEKRLSMVQGQGLRWGEGILGPRVPEGHGAIKDWGGVPGDP